MLYGPTGNAEKRYEPSSVDVTERVNPLSTFVAVTETPGTTAPVASFTTPEIVPVGNCAFADRHRHRTTTTAPEKRKCFSIHLPRNRTPLVGKSIGKTPESCKGKSRSDRLPTKKQMN